MCVGPSFDRLLVFELRHVEREAVVVVLGLLAQLVEKKDVRMGDVHQLRLDLVSDDVEQTVEQVYHLVGDVRIVRQAAQDRWQKSSSNVLFYIRLSRHVRYYDIRSTFFYVTK